MGEAGSGCALCGSEAQSHYIVDETRRFCCSGCHAVYNILTSKGVAAHFKDTEIFQQALKSGLISNPGLLAEIRSNQPIVPADELARIYFEIEDLWCPSCAEVIRLLLLKQKGVLHCVVDYTTDLASVEYSPRYISKERIFSFIRMLGYHPATFQEREKKSVRSGLQMRFIVSAFCSMNVMMLSYPIYASYFFDDMLAFQRLFVWLSFLAAIPIVTYCGWPIWKRLFNGLKAGFFGMEVLIFIGVFSAFFLSLYETLKGGNHVYYDSMSVIVTFVLLGKIVESKAKFSAKDSLFRLSRSFPKRGRKLFPDGNAVFTSLKEIIPGDCVVALTGEKIVLDGEVVEGGGACDESLMTGEAIPVQKQRGSMVMGGTVMTQGRLVYKVTAREDETALHQILSMVEKDIGNKSVYTRAVDPVIRRFVPLVVTLSCGTLCGALLFQHSFENAFLRAVSVLLISCPCAIGIAAPLAESHILNGLAKLGAIVRNRACLPLLGKETAFVFDKTGTVTEGRFRVRNGLDSIEGVDRAVLKGLVSRSIHPLSIAIDAALALDPAARLVAEEVAGRGLRAEHDGCYLLGSLKWMQENGVAVTRQNDLHSDLSSEVFFAKNKRLIAVISLGDRIREDAVAFIRGLKSTRTYLLSGDGQKSVRAVAEMCSVTGWKAECSPLEKRDFIDGLRKEGGVVAMVGDGINDAPALTGADIGISVVSATEISIQVSDLLLTTDRLEVIGKIRSLSLKGHQILRQNLFWAFIYNIVGIGLAIAGYLTPIYSAAAMVLSSLAVLFNARRIGNSE